MFFQKFGALAMVPVLVAAAPAYAEWHGNAHIENVEVTGSYLTDDTSEAGLKKARKEIARYETELRAREIEAAEALAQEEKA